MQLPVVEKLARHPVILNLGDRVFAPRIRTSVGTIRFPSKTAMIKFRSAWRQAEEGGLMSRFVMTS